MVVQLVENFYFTGLFCLDPITPQQQGIEKLSPPTKQPLFYSQIVTDLTTVATETAKLWRPDGLMGGSMYNSHPEQQRQFDPRLPTTQRNALASPLLGIKCLYQSVSTSSSLMNAIHLNARINRKKTYLSKRRQVLHVLQDNQTPVVPLVYYFPKSLSSSNMKFMLSRAIKSL